MNRRVCCPSRLPFCESGPRVSTARSSSRVNMTEIFVFHSVRLPAHVQVELAGGAAAAYARFPV